MLPTKRIHNWITSAWDVGVFRLPGRSMFSTAAGIGWPRIYILSILVLSMVFSGCGKKAMPVPPKAQPVPAVSDLSYEIHGGYVYLTWSLPAEVDNGRFGRGKMVVSRARIRPDGDSCDDCPLVFQQVAVTPIALKMGAATHTHRETLTPGFRYTFRVELQMSRGRTSGPSNLVTFNYQDF